MPDSKTQSRRTKKFSLPSLHQQEAANLHWPSVLHHSLPEKGTLFSFQRESHDRMPTDSHSTSKCWTARSFLFSTMQVGTCEKLVNSTKRHEIFDSNPSSLLSRGRTI